MNCPYCDSLSIIRRGVRKTVTESRQRYYCKECTKRFIDSPLKSLKVNPKFVYLAFDCYYKGLSYRDVADQFQQFYDIQINHETIRRWILKFSKILEEYCKTLNPRTSFLWNADETMILTKKGEFNYEYVWNVMDNKTKFLLASISSGGSRNIGDVKTVMNYAYAQNKRCPEQIITDRYAGYSSGIKSAFRNKSRENIIHTSIVRRRKYINNNTIENLHTHQKEFHKVRRGVNEVQIYHDGFKVFHNFIRKGVKDKQTPADRANIGISGNRWETLFENALKVPNATKNALQQESP